MRLFMLMFIELNCNGFGMKKEQFELISLTSEEWCYCLSCYTLMNWVSVVPRWK